MKLHRAAALTLLGWYLIQPPTHRGADGKSVVFEDARPLTMWKQIAAYDTAKECQAQISHMWTLPAKVVEFDGVEFLLCVASDDSRLK